MSRKDYVKFAEILSEAIEEDNSHTVQGIAIKAARYFKADNPAFRPVQFFEASGYSLEESAWMATHI